MIGLNAQKDRRFTYSILSVFRYIQSYWATPDSGYFRTYFNQGVHLISNILVSRYQIFLKYKQLNLFICVCLCSRLITFRPITIQNKSHIELIFNVAFNIFGVHIKDAVPTRK